VVAGYTPCTEERVAIPQLRYASNYDPYREEVFLAAIPVTPKRDAYLIWRVIYSTVAREMGYRFKNGALEQCRDSLIRPEPGRDEYTKQEVLDFFARTETQTLEGKFDRLAGFPRAVCIDSEMQTHWSRHISGPKQDPVPAPAVDASRNRRRPILRLSGTYLVLSPNAKRGLPERMVQIMSVSLARRCGLHLI